jgi:predicted small lipoprotein YifL
MNLRTPWLCLACVAALSIVGCEKRGPFERTGEEVDEAVDTAKNGHESTANKIDDAVDEARASIQGVADELKKD